MVEKSCVYKLIDRTQNIYTSGGTLSDAIGQIDHYQSLVRRAYGPIKNPLHRIFTSRIGLLSLATYEYGRFKGIPLPNLNHLIQTAWPIKRRVRLILFGGQDIFDIRPNSIDF
ncbi:hypothetical protein HYW42_05150 [Candidatus Daviesbacteria bacterium]|nr:hypothetical protein [Candidatus Daviesbacteria bacterium]